MPHRARDTRSPLRAELRPIQLLLQHVKRIVADLFRLAQRQILSAAPRRSRAAARRVGGPFLRRHDAIGIGLGAQRQRAVLQPQNFGFFGQVARWDSRRARRDRRWRGREPTSVATDSRPPKMKRRYSQQPQCQALDHQRAQHHGECRRQDEVALRKTLRQREGGGQRDDAAHPAP